MNIHEEITSLQTLVKNAFEQAKEEKSACSLDSICYRPNGKRHGAIEKLTEDYFAKTGAMPDDKALDKLADLLLHEELTDDDEHKIAHNEYPILSGTQIARRQEGKHARATDNPKIEVPLKIAENYGVDGRLYNVPTRRERSERENRFIDKEARIRNMERKEKYDEFTKIQPVTVRKMSL